MSAPQSQPGVPPRDDRTRNPHPDFKQVESQRPDWDESATFHFTKTVEPSWSFGDGANRLQPANPPAHVTIDPYEAGRPANFNYKLLISAVVPRPIAFVSTRAADGTTTNLAPFSYFNMINHDPPLFVIGFARGLDAPKDSLRHLLETKECVINIISEPFIEAANSCAINAPVNASEWDVSGLTPLYDCRDVKCARVKEAVFSVEGKLDFFREHHSKSSGRSTGCMVVIEGTRFWVREDALNEDQNLIDPAVLKPISRLGGIMYGRTTQAAEIPRADWADNMHGADGFEKFKKSKEHPPA